MDIKSSLEQLSAASIPTHILTKLITFFYSVHVPAGKGFPNTFAA
jgi:hypothetical protein